MYPYAALCSEHLMGSALDMGLRSEPRVCSWVVLKAKKQRVNSPISQVERISMVGCCFVFSLVIRNDHPATFVLGWDGNGSGGTRFKFKRSKSLKQNNPSRCWLMEGYRGLWQSRTTWENHCNRQYYQTVLLNYLKNRRNTSWTSWFNLHWFDAHINYDESKRNLYKLKASNVHKLGLWHHLGWTFPGRQALLRSEVDSGPSTNQKEEPNNNQIQKPNIKTNTYYFVGMLQFQGFRYNMI